jgi:hypothetical protein
MEVYILIILFTIHAILSVPFLLLPSSRLHKRKEYWLPVLLVPVFGPLMAVTIEILFRISKPGTRPVELESLKGEQDIFWTTFTTTKEDTDAVPLEEAILVNDIHTRRQAVLNTFRGDSFRYLDVLMVARNNEDVDTTHYATIQISMIQRQFQLQLQKYAADFERDPDNQALLDEYIDLLGMYLESSLAEQSILKHQRKVYDRLLDKKLSLCPNDRETLVKKLRNCTAAREDYPLALEVMGLLKSQFPGDEEIWIESLRACVEWEDTPRIQETLQEMRTQKIRWTRWGREQVSPWVQI